MDRCIKDYAEKFGQAGGVSTRDVRQNRPFPRDAHRPMF
jgi:hypothetical protein